MIGEANPPKKDRHYIIDGVEFDPNDPAPFVFGYARMSYKERVDSPEIQAKQIREWAAKVKGARYVGTWVDEGVSGRTVPYRKRPGCLDCFQKLRKGDKLVVLRLDRLERGGLMRLAKCLQELGDRGVGLHSLNEYHGERLNMELPDIQLLVFIMGWAAEFYARQQADQIRAVQAWRKSHGYIIGQMPMGCRRVMSRDPRHPHGKKVAMHIWDSEDCATMREIYRRRVLLGEPFYTIAREFHATGRKSSEGKEWAPMRKSRRRRGVNKFGNYFRLHNACRKVQALIDEQNYDHPILDGWDGTLDGEVKMFVPANPPDFLKNRNKYRRHWKMWIQNPPTD